MLAAVVVAETATATLFQEARIQVLKTNEKVALHDKIR